LETAGVAGRSSLSPPRGLVVSAPQSGAGKTTATMVLIAALRARALRVQPFKVGPDFLDPTHLTRVAGRATRTLDVTLTSVAYVQDLVRRTMAEADVGIVEGMMGLFDGVDGRSDRGSTAEIAALLGWPVVLVVDASAAARSVAAVVRGFRTFSPHVDVAAVLFDRVAGPGHLAMLRDACAGEGVTIVGGIMADAVLHVAERHLGLQLASEAGGPDEAALARAAAALDVDALLAMASARSSATRPPDRTDAVPSSLTAPATQTTPRCRIAVARDAAFCFYYEDNLDALRAAGAELVAWRPLQDAALPEDVDGLYLGGGYPELHARALAARVGLRTALRDFAVAGGMIYAECGGFMFLTRAIRLDDGTEQPMVGLFPGVAAMRSQLVAIGYRSWPWTLDGECLTVRGQEFRYSELVGWPASAEVDGEVVRALGTDDDAASGAAARSGAAGFAWRRVVAGYTHLHFGATPQLARLLVARAAAARSDRGRRRAR
jgi:cobyrinic acid a,c-diamide synthase